MLRDERVGETDSGVRGRTASRGQVTMLATVAFLGLSGICPSCNPGDESEGERDDAVGPILGGGGGPGKVTLRGCHVLYVHA